MLSNGPYNHIKYTIEELKALRDHPLSQLIPVDSIRHGLFQKADEERSIQPPVIPQYDNHRQPNHDKNGDSKVGNKAGNSFRRNNIY